MTKSLLLVFGEESLHLNLQFLQNFEHVLICIGIGHALPARLQILEPIDIGLAGEDAPDNLRFEEILLAGLRDVDCMGASVRLVKLGSLANMRSFWRSFIDGWPYKAFNNSGSQD